MGRPMAMDSIARGIRRSMHQSRKPSKGHALDAYHGRDVAATISA